MIVYCMSNRELFEAVPGWQEELENYVSEVVKMQWVTIRAHFYVVNGAMETLIEPGSN